MKKLVPNVKYSFKFQVVLVLKTKISFLSFPTCTGRKIGIEGIHPYQFAYRICRLYIFFSSLKSKFYSKVNK